MKRKIPAMQVKYFVTLMAMLLLAAAAATLPAKAAGADVDYYVSWDSTNSVYLVGTSAATTNDVVCATDNCTTLGSALVKCHDNWGAKAGTPVIQLGITDEGLTLKQNEFFNLISAVYKGKLTLSSSGGELIDVPSGVTADFEGLTVNTTITTSNTSDTYVIIMRGGNLTVGSGTTLTSSVTYNTPQSEYFGTINNEGNGMLTLNGGCISSTGTGYGHDGIINSSTGSVYIKDGSITLRSTSSISEGIDNLGTGLLEMLGGSLNVTTLGSNETNGTTYGLYDRNGHANISGGTITVKGAGAYAVRYEGSDSGSTVAVKNAVINQDGYGDAIEIYGYGSLNIENVTVNLKDTGRFSGYSDMSARILESFTTGTVTVKSGTYTAQGNNNGFANNYGTLNIDSCTLSAATGVIAHFGGTVNINGGDITSTGTNSSNYAVGCASDARGSITISGSSTKLTSANGNTVFLSKTSGNYAAHITIGDNSVYSHSCANVFLAGPGNVITLSNYTDATINAGDFVASVFKSWTNDPDNKTDISVLNPDSLKNLPATAIYLHIKVITAPSVAPTNGSFTDTNIEKSVVSGTLSWTKPSDTTDISGYKVYWGRSSSDISYDQHALICTKDGADSESVVIPDTSIPSDSSYMLIFCYNSAGKGSVCLAVAITDDDSALNDYTITRDAGSGKLEVNDSGDYSSLDKALAACTLPGSDNVLTVMMGKSASCPLLISDADISSPGKNALISAKYKGYVEITNDKSVTGNACGLFIPSGIEALFDNFTLWNDNLSASSYCALYTDSGQIMVGTGSISADSAGTAYGIRAVGTGVIMVDGSTVKAERAISSGGSGEISVYGGNIISSSNSDAAYAIGYDSDSANGTLNISGDDTKVKSLSDKTIFFPKNDSTNICIEDFLYINSSSQANIVLTGEHLDDGYYTYYESNNMQGTALCAKNMENGNKFTGWTKESVGGTVLSEVNGESLFNLCVAYGDTDSANIYQNFSEYTASAPSNGNFSDTDSVRGTITGTIAWTVPADTSDITGYQIYWGSDANTILSGSKNAVFHVAGASAASQTVSALTLPPNAAYLLIYSTNGSGASRNCLAIAVTDKYGQSSNHPARILQVQHQAIRCRSISAVPRGTSVRQASRQMTAAGK